MLEITYRQLREGLHLPADDCPDFPLRARVCTDSRQVGQGDVFVALSGQSNDGHQFLGQVAARGARLAIVCHSAKQVTQNGWASAEDLQNMTLVQVEDTQKALGQLAKTHLAWLRQQAKDGKAQLRTVIGITGSAGKTTTKDLVATILSTKGKTVAPQKSFNNEVGLPLTVLQAQSDTQYLVLEMGASNRGDLLYLTDIAPLDIAAVLMVGSAHLGAYGSVTELAKAKAEILTNLGHQALAVLNADDPRTCAMAGQTAARSVFFSARGSTLAGVQAQNITLDALSQASFQLCLTPAKDTAHGEVNGSGSSGASTSGSTKQEQGAQSAPVNLQIIGAHHVHNALAAAAIAHAVGVDISDIAQVLSQTGPRSEHRMQLLTLQDDIEILDDSYNANPDSMRAALQVLGRQGAKRRTVAVLGQMLELGPSAEQLHEEVGHVAGREQISIVIGVGQLAQAILRTYRQEYPGGQTHYAASAEGALELIQEIAQKDDLILLKGSNGCELWKIGSQLKEKGSIR